MASSTASDVENQNQYFVDTAGWMDMFRSNRSKKIDATYLLAQTATASDTTPTASDTQQTIKDLQTEIAKLKGQLLEKDNEIRWHEARNHNLQVLYQLLEGDDDE